MMTNNVQNATKLTEYRFAWIDSWIAESNGEN